MRKRAPLERLTAHAILCVHRNSGAPITRADRIDLDAMIAALRPETFPDDDPWENVPPVGNEMW
jgi:hypothetical protein